MVLVLSLTQPALSACSSEAWYLGFQAQQRKACLEDASSGYAACLERANRSYDAYQRELKERYGKE